MYQKLHGYKNQCTCILSPFRFKRIISLDISELRETSERGHLMPSFCSMENSKCLAQGFTGRQWQITGLNEVSQYLPIWYVNHPQVLYGLTYKKWPEHSTSITDETVGHRTHQGLFSGSQALSLLLRASPWRTTEVDLKTTQTTINLERRAFSTLPIKHSLAGKAAGTCLLGRACLVSPFGPGSQTFCVLGAKQFWWGTPKPFPPVKSPVYSLLESNKAGISLFP